MDTDSLLNLLREVAEAVVNPRFRHLSSDQVKEKAPGDLVTVADRESEELITARLRAAYPDALIVGEEAVSDGADLHALSVDADQWFTIDPIDGTKNFVNGSADHAMMLAEMRGREVVRGIIYQPAHDLAYVAERGAGAFADGVPMASLVRNQSSLAVRTSRLALVGQSVGDLPPLLPSWACCGVDYPRVALGQADGLYYDGACPWDHAAGSLLLSETGGWLGYADGIDYDPTSSRAPLVAAGDPATTQRLLAAFAPLS